MSKRPTPADGGDGERLPWLEPFKEPADKLAEARRRPAPARPRQRNAWWPIAAVALLAAVGGGGYWLGQRDSGEPAPAVETNRPVTNPLPLPPAAPRTATKPVEQPAPPVAAEAPPAEPEARPQEPKPRAERAKAPPPARKAKVRRADTSRPSYDRVVAKQREAVRTWPKMPSPGPAGQVIQLGAFSNRARARAAYRQRVARYPLLAGMPQVIVPVITRPRGQVLYVLRLGTQSRQQSQIVCRNLRRSGDHCLVIG